MYIIFFVYLTRERENLTGEFQLLQYNKDGFTAVFFFAIDGIGIGEYHVTQAFEKITILPIITEELTYVS